jgi:N-acyl-D-amino-acid deacylase
VYDLVLKNGKIIDGTGNCWFSGELGILNGRIKKIGTLEEESKKTLDISNHVVCPGFIDIHSHSDITSLIDPRSRSKVMQGVTTEVIGNCGLSPAPMRTESSQYLKSQFFPPEFEWNWLRFSDFIATYENNPASLNIASLVGHGTLRIAVMGSENRKPKKSEINKMKTLLKDSLDAGAFGLSTGLIYAPACYAETEEIIELAKLLNEGQKLYATHVRGEGANLVDAVKEGLRIGREAGVRVQISHHKAAGLDNWGKVNRTLELMDNARRSGIDVTCDVYPYSASSTDLTTCLPPWVREGGTEKMLERIKDAGTRIQIRKEMENNKMQGVWASPVKSIGWDRIVIAAVNAEENIETEGMNLRDIAASRKRDVFDVFFDFLAKENGKITCIYHEMCEEDVRTVMCHPIAMIASDGMSLSPIGILGKHKPHPRNYGTFPRVIANYVREEKLFTLEQAIRKMTSFPAQKLGLRERGTLTEGFWADLVVFEPSVIQDTATYEEPAQFPLGIKYVIVNGVVVVSEGRHTDATPGKLLKHS